ncbi:MAG: hypothetical protein ACK4MG_07970 [Aquabacterium sp.]
MPEPTSAALASCAAITSCLAVVATTMGVPAPVVLAAVLGAAIAVSSSDRLELSLRSLLPAVLSFGLAMGIGIWGGSLFGRPVVSAINAMIAEPDAKLPVYAADPICTLFLAMIGQRELLPIVQRVLRRFNAGEGQ